MFIYSQTMPSDWFSDVLIVPISLCMLAAIIPYLLAGSLEELMVWSITSQKRNYFRAESFYSQREQLRQALLDLQKANDQLANLNISLNEAQKHAEEASQAKSIFLSNVSHELRTPLNMVIGYTSSMLSMPQMYDYQEIPEIFRNDIELIHANGQYLLTLINDLLDLSKIEAGRLQMTPTAFDLVEICRGVIATAVGLARDKALQVIPDYPDDLPLVWGDSLRIRQILLNLMSNGIKYSNTGSVTLSAHANHDKIRIAVTDTGQGIPPELVEHIFDRYEQG